MSQSLSYVCVTSAVCQTVQALWDDEIVVRDAFQLDLFCFSVCFFCVSCADADITVWIRARLFPSRFERVDKGFPLGIASG